MDKTLNRQYQRQINGYYCGPAATRVAISTQLTTLPTQQQVASVLGTTEYGTNSCYDVQRGLNKWLPSGKWSVVMIPGMDATASEREAFRMRAKSSIDAGYGLVTNVVGTIQTNDGYYYDYNGGHYVAVVGYRNDGAEWLVADVDKREYWTTLARLTTWIASRGYCYSMVTADTATPAPSVPASPAHIPVGSLGVDYAFSRPSIPGLASFGVKFAARYLSFVNSQTLPKILTSAEALALGRAGIAVVSNYEWYPQRCTEGFAAGAEDARIAFAQAGGAGMPAGRPVYFSVDEDYSPEAVVQYFRGIASVVPVSQIGAYGSYKVIKYLKENGLITWCWQTYAWSGGQWYSGNHFEQYSNNQTMAGGTLDLNRSKQHDFGQWFHTSLGYAALGGSEMAQGSTPYEAPTVVGESFSYTINPVNDGGIPWGNAYFSLLADLYGKKAAFRVVAYDTAGNITWSSDSDPEKCPDKKVILSSLVLFNKQLPAKTRGLSIQRLDAGGDDILKAANADGTPDEATRSRVKRISFAVEWTSR